MSGWWPSRYGEGDEAGALNEISAGGIVRAARLVREGRVFDLAHVLDSAVPAFPGRQFAQRLGPAEGGIGRNQVGWVVEQVAAPSQIGTHMDGLNHLRIGDRSYNGSRDFLTPCWPCQHAKNHAQQQKSHTNSD